MKSHGQSKESRKGTKMNLFVKYFMTKESQLFYFSLVFYLLLSQFNSNNKTLFAAFFFLALGYLLLIKNFPASLLLAFIAALPITKGWLFTYELIPARFITIPGYDTGFNIGLTIGVIHLLVLPAIYLIIKKLISSSFRVKVTFMDLSISLYYFLLLISSLLSTEKNLSMFVFLLSVSPLFLYIFIRSCIEKKYLKYSLPVIMATLIFLFSLNFRQFINHSPTGSSLESRADVELFGSGADENLISYRPVATFNHPNDLASFVLPVLLISLPAIYLDLGVAWPISLAAVTAGLVTLLLTLSRSAWGSFVLALLPLAYVLEKVHHLNLIIPQQKQKFILAGTIILFITSSPVWFLRLSETINIFQESGGADTRIKQITDGFEIITNYPVLGVGPGLGGFYAWKYGGSGISRLFISPIHNSFLLIATESGLLSLIAIMLFLFFTLKTCLVNYLIKGNLISLFVFFAILGYLVNAQLQPNLDLNLIVLIGALVGIANPKGQKNEKKH